jgi:hypothetical protein
LSLLVLAMGVILLNPVSMALLLIVIAAATWHDLLTWITDFIGWLRGGLPDDAWPRFLALATAIMLILAFILALLPPSQWDVLTYHLAGPEQYVEEGRFYAVEHNHFLGFPQLVESLYAGQIALTGRLEGSALIHWVIGVFLLMSAGGYAARHMNSTAGWVTVSVLLVAASVWLEMTFAYTDLMPMGLAVIGLAMAVYGIGRGENRRFTSRPSLPDRDRRGGRVGHEHQIHGAVAGCGVRRAGVVAGAARRLARDDAVWCRVWDRGGDHPGTLAGSQYGVVRQSRLPAGIRGG